MINASGDQEHLLRQALARSPASVQAHADLCAFLCSRARAAEALALLDDVVDRQPDKLWVLSLKAAVLDAEQRTEEALGVHEALTARASQAAVPWLNYGHALKTVGRVADAVAAYRRSLALDPACGVAWWALADLRTVPFGAGDIARIEEALAHARGDLDTVQLHFAMGKAQADLGQFEASFRHYELANDLRGRLVAYDAEATDALVREIEAVFTPDLLARSAERGGRTPVPIFIVGMPRSGSTLVEQILASHPLVEGLGELPELNEIATRLGSASPAGWVKAIAALGVEELGELGESYLASMRRYRRTDRPFFTDKMPANWQYVGLIRLIMPEARIIDVRRHRFACCFSTFTTYFNRRTSMPANLFDLGRYYQAYVEAIDHFEGLLPGTLHRVRYEQIVEDIEGEARRLLVHLDLPFDPACLRFHENSRAIYTPSAQQVRGPITRDGLDRWRAYEPWLEPLKDVWSNEPTTPIARTGGHL